MGKKERICVFLFFSLKNKFDFFFVKEMIFVNLINFSILLIYLN